MATDPTGIRVLVADDEEEILELLGEYLRARGYRVHTASDGLDALDMVRSGDIDLVLTDMKMPSLDGLDLLIEVKKLPAPVATIVMTGFGTVETALRAMKDGAQDYLLKPFKLKDVHESIQRAAQKVADERRLRRTQHVLQFYELGLALDQAAALGRLYGLGASVAMSELDAHEVALWVKGGLGWEAVARGGQMSVLVGFDPALVNEALHEAGVLAEPVLAAGQRAGVLAVAGALRDGPEEVRRLRVYARVIGDALARTGWRPGS